MNNYVKLGDLIKSVSQTHKFDKDELVFLNTSDVFEGKILIDNYMPISEMKGQAKKSIKNGDILYSEIRPKNRRYAYVKGVKNIEDYVVSTKLMVLRNNSESLDTNYLYHFLTSQEAINYLQNRAENRIGSFPQITFEIVQSLSIWLPDLPAQQKIAAVLSALDNKIELNNKINAELEQMAKTLYDYWFVQFDFPNTEGKPYKSSGGKMVFNENLKREIPDGWEVKSLFEVSKVQYGFPFSTDFFNDEQNGIPVIRIRDILNNSISNYSTQNDIDEKYLIEKGDVLVGMDGNFHINYWSKDNCYLNQRVVMIKQTILPSIILRYQIEPYIQLREKSVSRTTVGHLSDKDLKAINILVPSDKILDHIKPVFKLYLEKIISNKEQNQELAQLRDWLLPMLMNGQVRVSEVGIGDRINEYANSELSHEKLVAETFGEYLPKKQHNINDINKELAALIYLMNYGLGANYGNVAVQKAVYNSSVITPNLYSKKHDFINYNFGTFSKGLADDLSHNPYLKTKKINGFEVYEIEPSKKNEILNVLSSAENKDFVSSINKLIDLYRQPFINKETNKMELLNTVLKIYSDLKTTDIKIIYQTMKDWKIKQTGFNTKAEKFSKQDTQQMIELLLRNNILR